MSRTQPLFLCLRPRAAPRPATCQQLFRFSTAARLRVEKASTSASSPKGAARAAGLAARAAATDADSAQAPAPKPTLPSKPTLPNILEDSKDFSKAKTLKRASKLKGTQKEQASDKAILELPPPKYLVSRSKNKNLPIYTDYKRGGNLHLTTVRKITGDISALRDELRVFLNKKNEDVKINSLTGHVVVKGHHAPAITQFLGARGM